jgi:hypothetical protein
MYTYAANVRDLSLVQGPFSVAPCQTLCHDSHFLLRCIPSGCVWLVPLRVSPCAHLAQICHSLNVFRRSRSTAKRRIKKRTGLFRCVGVLVCSHARASLVTTRAATFVCRSRPPIPPRRRCKSKRKPQKLTGLISPCTKPSSISSPFQTDP